MAKIMTGGLAGDIRGKIGGVVFQSGKAGLIIRNKRSPIQRRTATQQLAKVLAVRFAQIWRTLSAAQRAGWDGLAAEMGYTNVFGELKHWSGAQVHNKLNVNLINIGQSAIEDAPTLGAVEGIFANFSATASAGAGTLLLNWSSGDTSATIIHKVFASRCMSQGRYPSSSDYRLVSTIPGGQATNYAISGGYIAKFGAMRVGTILGVKIIPIDTATGLPGVPLTATAIVGA